MKLHEIARAVVGNPVQQVGEDGRLRTVRVVVTHDGRIAIVLSPTPERPNAQTTDAQTSGRVAPRNPRRGRDLRRLAGAIVPEPTALPTTAAVFLNQ